MSFAMHVLIIRGKKCILTTRNSSIRIELYASSMDTETDATVP